MHAFGACCGSLDALEISAYARSISMKVSQSSRQLAKVVSRWADGELRSMNAQIEFVLRRALQQAGRLPEKEDRDVAAIDND